MNRSAYGMALIVDHICDSMDLLVDRSSRPQRHSEGDLATPTVATHEPSPSGLGPSGGCQLSQASKRDAGAANNRPATDQ
jgi:hypothetical protein